MLTRLLDNLLTFKSDINHVLAYLRYKRYTYAWKALVEILRGYDEQ